MRSSNSIRAVNFAALPRTKKIVAGLLLVAAVIFLASVIGGIFRYKVIGSALVSPRESEQLPLRIWQTTFAGDFAKRGRGQSRCTYPQL